MRINGNGWQFKTRSPDNIGSLAPDSGQSSQHIHLLGHFAAMVRNERRAALHDIPGLVPEKPGGMDVLLQYFTTGSGKGCRIRILFEQGRRDTVDAFIRALGGKNSSHQKLHRVLVVQGAFSFRVLRPEAKQDLREAFPLFTNIFRGQPVRSGRCDFSFDSPC